MFTTVFLILTAVSESLVRQSLSYSRTDFSESQTNSCINVWQIHKGSWEWFHRLKIKKNIAGKFTFQSWSLILPETSEAEKSDQKLSIHSKREWRTSQNYTFAQRTIRSCYRVYLSDSGGLMNDAFPGENSILSLSPKLLDTFSPGSHQKPPRMLTAFIITWKLKEVHKKSRSQLW